MDVESLQGVVMATNDLQTPPPDLISQRILQTRRRWSENRVSKYHNYIKQNLEGVDILCSIPYSEFFVGSKFRSLFGSERIFFHMNIYVRGCGACACTRDENL